MNTELLACGHPPDAGAPYAPGQPNGWTFVLDGGRKICHACADARILDCGHTPSPHKPFTTGYGITPDGKTHCYTCCAAQDRANMVTTGRATLYLTKDKAGAWQISNWPGSLTFPVARVKTSPRSGGFGCQRTDAWFRGPDGNMWHAVNRGDNQIARCRRLKA